MTAYPKPEKRTPRPRKRIARAKPPARKRRTSQAAQVRQADKLFGQIVRHPGRCLYHMIYLASDCAGPLQCAHIVSRIYRSVRWDERNALPLCAGAHRYFTCRPLEWERFIADHVMDRPTYEGLKLRALEVWDHDMEPVLARLRQRAVELGL